MINVYSFRRRRLQEEDNKESDVNNDMLMTQTVKEDERDPVKDDQSKDITLSDECDFNFDEIVSKLSYYVNALLNFRRFFVCNRF